jgi:hypothetical protein
VLDGWYDAQIYTKNPKPTYSIHTHFFNPTNGAIIIWECREG